MSCVKRWALETAVACWRQLLERAVTKPHVRTSRDLLAAFHRAMVALSADDLAEMHALDALYEFRR